MATRIGHTATGLLLGAALVLGAGGRAAAQCVGDCNDDGEVTINELIIGVNIALGEQPASACPAFANGQGEVTIAQLILGVNNALGSCPATPTPTTTPSPTPTTGPAGNCRFVPGQAQSHLELYVAALANPIILNLTGSMDVDCTVPGGEDTGECACGVAAIDPIRIPGVGTVCIEASPDACPPAPVQCEGGPPVGVDLRSNGDVGACTGNQACRSACETSCAGAGSVRSTSGCTGYCSLGDAVVCNSDADCLPDNGACNGPDPVGARADICQCGCVDAKAGPAGVPGDLQCNLGVTLTVEANAPCDGGDVNINLGSACIGTTTGTASTLIANANFGAGTVPGNGTPASSSGAPIACTALTADDLGGLKLRGVVNFFGSALGDLATMFAADCE